MAGVDGDQHEVEGSAGAPGGLAAKMFVVKVHTGAQDADGGPVTALNPYHVTVRDPTSGLGAGVAAFHNADNQNLGTVSASMLTGGVAQLLNPNGFADRQRGAGADGTTPTGVSTGAASFAASFVTTTTAIVTGNPVAQTVPMAATVGLLGKQIQVGSVLNVDAGLGSQEYAIVTAVAGLNVTGIFAKGHASGASVATYVFNMERDASGENDGADGRGTAVAAEYEFNGLAYDRARSVQGKNATNAVFTGGGGTGTTSATFAIAPPGLAPGQQVFLLGGAGVESIKVDEKFAGGTTVTFTTAIQGAARTSMTWDAFASNGPGLTGFSPLGMGIEESVVYDPNSPVGQNFYLERSATNDAAGAANVVLVAPAVWNGATMDRLYATSAKPTTVGRSAVGVGSGVVTSLNAVAANTTSAVTNLGTLHAKGALQVVLTGAPSGGTVTLQGSLDGINFDAVNTLAVFTIGTDLSGAIKFVVDKPFIAFRTVLSGLAGGAAPTVTALVAAY